MPSLKKRLFKPSLFAIFSSFTLFCCVEAGNAQTTPNKKLYEFDASAETRWSSFENMNGNKGKGGMENNGAKGHPSDPVEPGETQVLLDVKGTGMINRIWITIIDRSPEMLRSLKLEMFWDDEKKPPCRYLLVIFLEWG
jgi:hypothetical protein